MIGEDGASVDEIRARIKQNWGREYGLLIPSYADYRRDYLEVPEGSFGPMRALELVAVLVAVLGVLNTLLVTVIDRRTEIGTLKAIGAEPRQIRALFGIESALMGAAATVLGVGAGSLFSIYIVKELLRFQMGWQMSWGLSGLSVLETVVLAQVVVFLAALWPMHTAANIDAAASLHYE